jgi:hypothetical protein
VSDATSPIEAQTAGDELPPGRQVRVEIVAGVSSMAVAAFFLLGAGSGRLDWIFPDALATALGAIGVVLIIRGILGYGDLVPIIPAILRGAGRDVAIFIAIAIAFVVLVRPLGFWPVSGLMIFGTSVYLAQDRSRRTIVVSLIVALAVCVVAFFLLERIFYVPFPRASWLGF